MTVLRELVEYEYPGKILTPDQEARALHLMRYNRIFNLKEYLDSELGPPDQKGPLSDIKAHRS